MKINPLVTKSLAIIGVPVLAAAILFPVFANARENARRSSCQSNLKQIGLGMAQYAQDNDGKLPLVKGSDFPNNASYGNPPFGWADALQPYTKSVCMLNCPDDVWPPMMQTVKGSYSDYWMNARLSGNKRNERAAHVVLLGDGVGDKLATARYALSAPPSQTPTCGGYNNTCQSAWKHLGGANFGFLDGHVKWLKPDEVSVHKGDAVTFAP